MSLIDPNQIISLAPSQNVGQPTVPFAPGSATAAVYDRDLDQDVAGSIMQAGTYDPTAAAKAIRLSQETRIPFPLAQNNYDDLAHRQKITAWQQTVSQNPTLVPLLRDPEFAAVAQDDSQNVGWWTRFKSSIADLNKAREDWWFETTKDIATGGMIGFRVAQRGQVGARMMDSEITPEDRETIRKADADLKAFQRPASFLGSAAELIGQQVVTVPEALREAAVGATAGGLAGAIGGPLAPATMAGGMALGATAGLATGFARQAYRVEAGNAYVDMIDKGVDPDTAYPVAMGIGLVNASLELGGASFVAKPFQQAFRLAAKNAINEAIIQPTTRQALRAAGASYVKAIGAETSTEVMQEVVTMVGEEAAMLASGIDSELTAADAAKRVVDTAIHTAMGMAVLGVPGAGVTLYSGMRASARTQREQNALTQIAQNAKDTKFRADAPTVYERLAATQLNGTSAETTYIDAERVKEVLDQAGLTPAEIDQVLPGVRQQLPDALASRGDVTIPTAKWAANTVGTKIEAALLPHMRLSATSMSPVEAAAFQAEREQLVAEASQILEQKQAVDAEWTRQAKDIADTIRQQAVAVRGMTETDADVFASGVQAFYVTKAVEMGMTPEQLFRLAPYTIQGEAVGVVGEMAPVSRMEIAPGVLAPARPAGMPSAAYERLILGEFEAPALPAAEMFALQTQADAAATAVEQSSIDSKAKSGLVIAAKQIGTALRQGNAVELANALWKLRERMSKLEAVPAELQALAAEIEARLAALGITIEVPQVDAEHRGQLEMNVVAFMPNKDAAQVFDRIKTVMAPVVRRNGAVISRGQVVVEAGAEAFEEQRAAALDVEQQRMNAEHSERMARVRQAAAAVGVPLEQANRNIIASVDAELGNIMEAAREASRAAGKTKSRDTQAAALKAKQDWVAANPVRYAEYQSAQRMESLENERIREAAASALAGKIDESLATAAKTLMDAGFVLDYESPAPSKSKYYRKGNVLIRLSDHEIPVTPERAAARAAGVQVPYRDFVFDGTEIDAELLQDLETAAARTMPSVMEQASRLMYPSLAKAWDRYTSGERYMTIGDLADKIESLDLAGKRIPQSVLDAVQEFRNAQREEREIYGERGGTEDDAGNALEIAVQNAAEQMREEELPPNIMEQAATMDAEYMAAVERGDMDTAQRMVDAAAKSAWYDIVAEHQTNELFTEFRAGEFGFHVGTGLPPGMLGQITMKLRVLIENPLRMRDLGVWSPERVVYSLPENIITDIQRAKLLDEIPEEMRTGVPDSEDMFAYYEAFAPIREFLKDAGYDGIVYRNEAEGFNDSFIAFDPEQLKSADPVTRDEAGNVIPLSRRFDITSPRIFEQAPVTPGFYSALEREVSAIDAKALPASGWSERFKGLIAKGAIKADELEWSGLSDYLKMQEGKVSKDAVLEFLRGNGVRVEQVTMQDVRRTRRETPLFYVEGPLDVVGRDAPGWFVRDADGSFEEGPFDSEAEAEQVSQQLEAEAASKELAARPRPTKYARYTLPGGRNYREVLLTLPFREPSMPTGYTVTETQYDDGVTGYFAVTPTTRSRAYNTRAEAETELRRMASGLREWRAEQAAFRSTHWEQRNVLVHLRMNDRVDADGKRVLFVEEVQSDWGQAGVKYGFVNQRAADEAELANLLMQQETKPSDALKKQIARVQARIKRGEYNVFRAPYVETTDGWLNLGLKQVLLEAVRGNYDRVAFVNGEQSKDRYDLSKEIESLSWTGYDSRGATKLVSLYPKQGNPIELPLDDRGVVVSTGNQFDGKELDEIVPKEIADQIMANRSGELAGDQLKVGGEGMVAFYDKIVPIAMGKLLKKYGGGKIGTVEIDTRTPESEAWYAELTDADILPQPGFDITPEMVKKLESGLPLFQAAAASGPRGGHDPRTLTTFINKGGDRSTWIHETAHFHFAVLGRLASRADAPERIRADMDTLLQWGRIDGATPEERLATWNAMTVDQQRKLHEQFAYSWEVYQFEGKAPSVEMQGVFERFRMWLMRVYKSVLEINAVYRSQFGEDLPALTPEVRQVMDRMLATQEQIERQQAINQMIPSFQSQDESGMSDAEWAAYQKMQAEATEAAVTDLGKASLSQMEWLSGARSRLLKQMQTRNARARREMRDEVSRQVRSDPTYRALRYIRTGKIEGPDGAEIVVDGPHKLSTAGVREIIDALPMDRLIDLNMLPEGVMAENGRDPDLVASDFGFDSGDALLRAMVGMRSLEDEINARTDARLLAENALMSPEQMEEEVQRAIHNEARARFVAVEQRWLERLDRPARIILEAAKQAARAKVAGTLVRDLRPQQWIAAESKAARDARLAYSNRRTPEEIGKSVYTRVYNEQEAAGTGLVEAQVIAEAARVKAVADAQARLDAFRAAYPEADPAAIAIRAKRAQTYNNQMAAQTLEAKAEIEKAVVYLRRVLRAENRKKMGADYADQIEGILERFDLAAISTEKARARQALAEWLEGERKKGLDPELPPVIADEAERKPYKNMTVAEFRELADAVRTLEYMGKNTTKILLAGKRLEFEATRDRIVETGEENAERRGRKAKPPVSVPTKLQRRIEAIRGYHAAQLTPSAIIQTIDGGEDGPLSRYLLEPFAEQANFQTEQRVRATEFLDKTLRPIIKSPRNRPIVIDSIGRSMQLEERLVVALNYGNDGNARRLLVGEDWTEAQVADILATLTKAELEAVQKIWDFFETFRPMISAKERRLTGKDLEYVDRRELTVPRTADGQSVTLPGGYYPIRYDPRRSTMVQAIDEVEEAKRMMDGARTASTTSDTFKKKRSQNGLGKPLTLTMNALYSGVNEVIDDLSWQEWLIAANRLMRDGKFAKMVRERYGDAYYQQLREWISTVAVGDRVASSVVENMAVAVRQNVSVSAMAWRAVTAGIQITGIFPAAAKIGTINTLRGLTYLMTSPRQASERAREKSKFMANRGRTRYRDLNEIRNLVRGETGIRRNYMATAYAAIGAMQSISDNTTWWGRYESAKRDGRDEDTAVFLADQAVKDTQGSGLTGDLSSVMRGGKAQSPYVKLFTSFMQYSNTMYSLTSERAMTANGRGDLAARLFLILIPGAILEELIRNLLTAKAEEDEPEELVRRLAANQLDYLISLPFGIRELTGIGDVLLGVEPRYQYRGPSGLRAISATGQLVNELSQGEFDAGLRRALINFVGITTGAPSTQINATIDGINAVMEGEAEGADVILAPITGFKTR